MLTFGFIITILGLILCLVAFVDGWAETVIDKIEDAFSCEWDVNVVTMVIAAAGIMLALTGIVISAYIVLKRIRDSWWYSRKEYRRRLARYENERTLENLRSAYDYVCDYYKRHPDCIRAAYNIGWCTYLSWFVKPKTPGLFDDDYAVKLLEWAYSQGDVDSAWLLGLWYGKIAAEVDVANAGSAETWKKRYFQWTQEFVEHNPRKTKRQKQEDNMARRNLASCYSQGYGTDENYEMATQLFDGIKKYCKKDYGYASDYADHLLKYFKRDAEKWYRKAIKLAPNIEAKASSLYGLFKVGEDFNDFSVMNSAREELGRLYLQAKVQADKETLGFVAESYSLAENTYRFSVAKQNGQKTFTVMELPECERWVKNE